MRLLIHAGLHKTGSTYLQLLLNRNIEPLANAGIAYYPDAKMVANHGTAWMAVADNYLLVRGYVQRAMSEKRKALILSSEDFEGMIFRPRQAMALEQAARSAGAQEVEWHFCLRDPGEYLESIYAELSKTTFVDYAALFVAASRDGHVRVDREMRRMPRSWDFCFDHARHLRAFAGGTTGKVVAHDFRDATPFPGHRLFDEIGGPGVLVNAAPEVARNTRLPAETVASNMEKHLMAVADGMPPDQFTALLATTRIDGATRAACASVVRAKYGPSMREVLDERVVVRRQQPLAMS